MRRIALLGGTSYIIIFFTAIFANFFAIEAFKVQGDPISTFNNFNANQDMLWLAVLAITITVVFDFFLSWVFYRLFKENEPKLAKFTAIFRFIYTVFIAVAIVDLVGMIEVLSENTTTAANNGVQVYDLLESFNEIWLLGLVFFGIHLSLLSTLICKTHPKMKIISGLLMLAGLGYIVDTILQFTYADYHTVAELAVFVVILPGIIGELALTVWLFIKASRLK